MSYIKLSKACELLDVNKKTLLKEIANGNIEAFQLPSRQWRINQDSLQNFTTNKIDITVNKILRSL